MKVTIQLGTGFDVRRRTEAGSLREDHFRARMVSLPQIGETVRIDVPLECTPWQLRGKVVDVGHTAVCRRPLFAWLFVWWLLLDRPEATVVLQPAKA